MEVSLWQAPSGVSLQVKEFGNLSEDARLVLQQLGLVPGENIEKLHIAPFGDPLAIRIDGHRYTLRKEVSEQILVSEENV